MNYAQVLEWLYGRQRFGTKLGLETMRALLNRLDHPEASFRALHVTGTTGKGSVCALLEAALRKAGHRVGLYTSPHLVNFQERIVVDGNPIEPEDVARGVQRLKPIVEDLDSRRTTATFFECVTALAFQHFRDARAPLVVTEVGLGGRLDATNLCLPIVSVITNVGMDHMDRLGPSIQSIAAEKAGILRPGVPAVTAARREALDVLARKATQTKTQLRVVRRPEPVHETLEGTTFRLPYQGASKEFSLGLLGEHQAENAAVALAALEAIQGETPVPVEAAQAGFAEARWPGRLEIVDRDPLTLIDGAHNAPGMDALTQFLGRHFPDQTIAAVVGILRDKQATRMLELLAPRISRMIVTRAPNSRALSPEELEHALPRDAPPATRIENPSEALRTLFTGGSEPVKLITGSLFLVGLARGQILRLERDPDVPHEIVQ